MEVDDYYTSLPKGASILSQDIEDLKGLNYRPRTKESRSTYELLLSFIQHCIGDQVSGCGLNLAISGCGLLKLNFVKIN